MSQSEDNAEVGFQLNRNRYKHTIAVSNGLLTKTEILAASLLTSLLYFSCFRDDAVISEWRKNVCYTLYLILILVFVRRFFWGVRTESIFIVKTLGLQKTTVYHSNFKSSVFIPWHSINDIIINEAIVMQKVIFYLAVLVKNEKQDRGESLIPLFSHSLPRLAELRKIYKEIQFILNN